MIPLKYLVAHYKMNDNADNAVVKDSMCFSNGIYKNGTGIIATSSGASAGKINGALNFDGNPLDGGTNIHIDTGNPFESVFQNSFSISIWAKPTDGNPAHSGFFFGISTSVPSLEHDTVWIVIGSNGSTMMEYTANDNSAKYYSSSALFSDGQEGWHHLIMIADSTIKDEGGLCGYFDNTLITPHILFKGNTSNVVFADFASTINPFIGAERLGGEPPCNAYNGLIDSVTIWKKALIQSERDYLWNSGNGRETLFTEFPELSVAMKIKGFKDEHSDGAVTIADPSQGYPFINKQFDFDPRNFSGVLRHASQTDKNTIMSFYQTNRNKPFCLLNEQENKFYEAIFNGRPSCNLDNEKDKWKIELPFRQAS